MRIQNVTINKYKAFTKEEKIPIGGKNVFMYGENGSGKSSFYYALKDFFQSSVENIDMSALRNLFLNDGGTDCSIEVEFEGGAKFTLNDTTKTTTTPAITDANRLKSFITYKHLLAVHNIKIGKQINVFDLVINGVLKHFKSQTITGGEELGKLWENVVEESKKPYGSGHEFYFAKQKKSSVEQKAIAFNNAINKLFLTGNPDYLAPTVNKILGKLVPDLKIEFQRRTVTINQWGEISESKILLLVESAGKSLDAHNPQFVLNEAKLSAIAISIFLGAIVKQSPFSRDIKPLFLDDILIGLDNENRLKLLQLLQEKEVAEADKVFKDFQVFITTYDRHWYEVAKLNLGDWKFVEFYKGTEGPEIIHQDKTNLEKAKAYFNVYDFPASANALRKECENLFHEKLLATYSVGEGLKGLVKPPNLETLIDNLKRYYDDLGIEPPTILIESLYLYKSILFNPMSHNDLESPIYKNDLVAAFKVIDDLKNITLPERTLLVAKGSMFDLNLPAINYQAKIEIAKNIYSVTNNGANTKSPVTIYFKDWTREGVQFAKPTGVPPEAYPSGERLAKIKESPFTIDKAIIGLNVTYNNRGVVEITTDDLLRNLTKAGDILYDILNP
jgi:hypothetical protein